MKRLLVVLLLIVCAGNAHAEIYTWKDNRGTRFYTNSLHEIPTRYLKIARVLDVATGKIGGLATAQPATAPVAAPSPAPQPAPLAPPQATLLPAPQAAPPAGRDATPPAVVTTQAPAAKVDPDAIYRASERAQRSRGTVRRRSRTEE